MVRLGMSRKIDELGRIVIPKEVRDLLGFDSRTLVEIYLTDDGNIGMRKYAFSCFLCGAQTVQLKVHRSGKSVCRNCYDHFNKEMDENGVV